MRGSETPDPIWKKFCTVVDIPDIITCANFGEDRLRGLEVAGGQSLPFSVDFWSLPLQHTRTTVRVCDYFDHLFVEFVVIYVHLYSNKI